MHEVDIKKEKAFYEQAYDTPAKFLDEPFDAWRMEKITALGASGSGEGDIFSCKSVLNIACGRGREAKLILEHKPQRMILADFSFTQLTYALSYLGQASPVAGLCCFGESLPFKDKSVDVCFIEEALHHFRDPEEGIREMARVARRFVVIDEPRKGAVRGFLNRVFVLCGLKEDVEHGHFQAYRLGKKELDLLRPLSRAVVCFPYFFYSFTWYTNTNNEFLKRSYRFFLRVLNRFFHRFGNKILIIARL